MKVLVAGASGFVGRKLCPALAEAGHDVRAMTRHPDDYHGAGTQSTATCTTPPRWPPHWMGVRRRLLPGALVGLRATSSGSTPRPPGPSASPPRRPGSTRIVYLGGLGNDTDELSPHLRSRREVEGLLGAAGVPVTVLRAGIIIGHGGISWEITRQLVEHLPAMVTPRWVRTRTQPIALDDVIRYLVGVLEPDEAEGPRLRDRRARGLDATWTMMQRVAVDPGAAAARSCPSRCCHPGCRRVGSRWSPTSTRRPAAHSSTR